MEVIEVHTDAEGRLLKIETSLRDVVIVESREGEKAYRYPLMFTGVDFTALRARLRRWLREPLFRKKENF